MTDIEKYNEFLETKKTQKIVSGVQVKDADLNPLLVDVQK